MAFGPLALRLPSVHVAMGLGVPEYEAERARAEPAAIMTVPLAAPLTVAAVIVGAALVGGV